MKYRKDRKDRKAKAAVLIFFIGIIMSGKIRGLAASTEFISQQYQMIYFSDGSTILAETTEDELILTGTHVKSASKISYETIGFHVTLEKTGGYVEGSEHREITLLSKEDVIDSQVTTTYRLDRQSIVDNVYDMYAEQYPGMADDIIAQKFLEEVNRNEGISFYLHNIFCVIERSGGSGSTVLARSDPYHNLGGNGQSGILTAVSEIYGSDWSDATKEKLKEYYDIHLKLYMEPCEVSIVLADNSGNVLEVLLEHAKSAHHAVMRYTIPERYSNGIEYAGEKYHLTEQSIRNSYVSYEGYQGRQQTYSLSDPDGLKIRLQSGNVEFRQLYETNATVYIVCEKVKSQEGTPEEGFEETEERISVSWLTGKAELKLAAWEPMNARFHPERPEEGIPVLENLFIEGRIPEYLLKIEILLKSGQMEFQVPVTRGYHLIWQEENEEGEMEEFTDDVEVIQYVPITWEYAYAELGELVYYECKEIQVISEVLPDRTCYVSINEFSGEPVRKLQMDWKHYSGQDEHCLIEEQYRTGIHLEDLTLYGEGAPPEVPEEDFEGIARAILPKNKVRSDGLWIGGTCCMEDEYTEEGIIDRAAIISALQQWQPRQVSISSKEIKIPAGVANGTYPTAGKILYANVEQFHATENMQIELIPREMNSVTIHTPVYCLAEVWADNKQYCQLVTPNEGVIHLIPDEEAISGDFIVQISNYGYHSGKTGYGTRDYSKTLSGYGDSYIARNEAGILRNEVCFPFVVWRDAGNDGRKENDVWIAAGQWIALGEERVRFYLPPDTGEGIYEVKFRTVAVNANGRENRSEAIRNTSIRNYVATDSRKVQISGKLYGFEVFDITDIPVWGTVFRDEGKVYYSGVNDQYGRSCHSAVQALAIVPGSHPTNMAAVYKPGYAIRFRLTSSGMAIKKENAEIVITPSFFYADASGRTRERVKLYYLRREADGRNYLREVGGNAANDRIVPNNPRYPEYTYGCIKVGVAGEKNDVWKRNLEFEYSLPYSLCIAAEDVPVSQYAKLYGIDFSEDFWKTDGYLILHLDISEWVDGAPYLDYANEQNENSGCGNMWKIEGNSQNKTGKDGIRFPLCPGDILVFPIGQSIRDDYRPGGIY